MIVQNLRAYDYGMFQGTSWVAWVALGLVMWKGIRRCLLESFNWGVTPCSSQRVTITHRSSWFSVHKHRTVYLSLWRIGSGNQLLMAALPPDVACCSSSALVRSLSRIRDPEECFETFAGSQLVSLEHCPRWSAQTPVLFPAWGTIGSAIGGTSGRSSGTLAVSTGGGEPTSFPLGCPPTRE